jgi:hypothetical protein
MIFNISDGLIHNYFSEKMDDRFIEIISLLYADDFAGVRQKVNELEVSRQIERMEEARSADELQAMNEGCLNILDFHSTLDQIPGRWYRRYLEAKKKFEINPYILVYFILIIHLTHYSHRQLLKR